MEEEIYIGTYPDGSTVEFDSLEDLKRAGFCPGCGDFWAGVESFDFNWWGNGYCDNCQHTMRAELRDYDNFGHRYDDYDDDDY